VIKGKKEGRREERKEGKMEERREARKEGRQESVKEGRKELMLIIILATWQAEIRRIAV
jgi:flagellar biosynthesis/type III secretory pathway protein FliH